MKMLHLTVLTPLAAAACTTVDQAPLVYISTVKIGVGASAGAPESPGAKVLIGYDQTDAAYVPVQIARRCERRSADDCKESDFPIYDVRGSSSFDPAGVFDRARVLEGRVDQARQTYSDKVKDLAGATATEHDNAEKARQFAAADAIVKGWEARASAASPGFAADGQALPAPSETDAVSRARSTLNTLVNAQSDAEASTEARRTAESDAAKAGRELETLQRNLATVLQQEVTVTDVKNDALSVYGSFDGDATTGVGANGAPSAGLKLGKTFSTGVAAQLLTQGIKEAAAKAASPQAACLANATAAANLIVNAPDKLATFLLEASKVCQAIQ
jgi:hypothetical protein